MKIANHKLFGEKTDFVEANSYNRTAEMVPDSIIIHYTAGPSGEATVKLFQSKSSKFSAHIVAHENGRLTQMVDFNRKAIHAGESYYDGRKGFNNFSIGIEISNPGYLFKNPKGSGFITWWDKKKDKPTPVPDDKVFFGKHRNSITTMEYWHTYTQEQIDAVFELCKELVATYPIKMILGHEEIAPGRKTDPGPAFPLDLLRKEVFSNEKKSAAQLLLGGAQSKSAWKIGFTTTKLNFRAEPNVEAALKANPIPPKTPVYILNTKDDWLNIMIEVTGWIDKEDIEQDNSDTDTDGIILVDKPKMYMFPDEKSKLLITPFFKDNPIYIKEQQNGFFKITANVNGWVMAKFVTLSK